MDGTCYNPSTQEGEAERSGVQDHPQLHRKFEVMLPYETFSKLYKAKEGSGVHLPFYHHVGSKGKQNSGLEASLVYIRSSRLAREA